MQGRGGYYASGPAYGRRRDPYRDQAALRLVTALLQHVYMMETKPPVTLALAAINLLVFLRPGAMTGVVPSIRAGCLLPAKVLLAGQWSRLAWAPFLHADETHIYYNMASLLWKGSRLEPMLGSAAFAALVAELAAVSGLLYLAVAAAGSAAMASAVGAPWPGPFTQCAVGFSGVLFGLKVVLNWRSPGWSSVAGVRLPTKYAAWAELVAIQLVTPGASFLGHLCGIAAGLLHVGVVGPAARRWAAARRRRGGAGGRPRGRTYGSGTWGGGR